MKIMEKFKSIQNKISKKKIIAITASISCLVLVFMCTKSFGMQHYYNLNFTTGLVTASKLNVRSGPGTAYSVVTTVNKDEYVRVFAGVGNWYIIQTPGDYVGAVSQKYIKPIYPNTGSGSGSSSGSSSSGGSSGNTSSSEITLTADELETFNLINQERNKNGLSSLKIDNEVQRVARIKAQDLVDNNYFAHESPTYGTPFNMLKNFGVSYKTAGENLAGNSSNSGAVNAWMNSSGHRANILNSSYNYTGVAVISSPKYGKIYVQMFIGK